MNKLLVNPNNEYKDFASVSSSGDYKVFVQRNDLSSPFLAPVCWSYYDEFSYYTAYYLVYHF